MQSMMAILFVVGVLLLFALLVFLLRRRFRENREYKASQANKKRQQQEQAVAHRVAHAESVNAKFQSYMAETPEKLRESLALKQRMLAHAQKNYAETEAKIQGPPSKHPHLNKLFFKVFKPAGDVAPGGLANQDADRSVEIDAFNQYCVDLRSLQWSQAEINEYEEEIKLMTEALNRVSGQ